MSSDKDAAKERQAAAYRDLRDAALGGRLAKRKTGDYNPRDVVHRMLGIPVYRLFLPDGEVTWYIDPVRNHVRAPGDSGNGKHIPTGPFKSQDEADSAAVMAFILTAAEQTFAQRPTLDQLARVPRLEGKLTDLGQQIDALSERVEMLTQSVVRNDSLHDLASQQSEEHTAQLKVLDDELGKVRERLSALELAEVSDPPPEVPPDA